MTPFEELLRSRLDAGGGSTDDVLASLLPLMRQVADAHRQGRVAPLEGLGALRVEGSRLWFEERRVSEPRVRRSELLRIERSAGRAVDVVGESRLALDIDDGSPRVGDLPIGRRGEPVEHPVYLPGHVGWEHEVGHHDPITDIFSVGLLLASLSCSLDLSGPEDLERFVASRRNLFRLNRRLHPVLARAIVSMTELERRRRPQDLSAVVNNLENYRDQEVDLDIDLARAEGLVDSARGGKREMVLSRLQERLFEISRRNRLLHFRPTMQSVNLTWASMPLSLDIRSVRPEQILTWNRSFQDTVTAGKDIPLNRTLRFEDALYLPGVLDRIRSEARRDRAEFGFAQLRLVLCFLRWSDLKETPHERFNSPLALLPVELVKKRGVRDRYWLRPLSSDVEVNPVLRHHFKQLYGIELPESVDLAAGDLDELHDHLEGAIAASEPAVTLARLDRPRIEIIHEKARRRFDQYRRRVTVAGHRVRTFLDLDYSYHPDNYHPLGLRLFQTRIRPPATHLEEVIEAAPRARSMMKPQPRTSYPEVEKRFYTVGEGEEDNPYEWEFDLCAVTLANFRYRKMSLVRDYHTLLSEDRDHLPFDSIFSLAPRRVPSPSGEVLPLQERFHILPCDPTQTAAIAQSRRDESYIIQGSPGTGKSQTIANLIADHVARGRRVLFVCEKRAAIDVVYHRLRQQGLTRLCCLIHDSQADKKSFVRDLRETYELLLSAPEEGEEEPERRREKLLGSIRRELRPLERFDESMLGVPEEAGVPLHDLLVRSVELADRVVDLSALEAEQLPPYRQWWTHSEPLRQLRELIGDIQGDGVLANHPLRLLGRRLLSQDHPLAVVARGRERSLELLDKVEQALERVRVDREVWPTFEALRQLLKYAVQVEMLAREGQMELLHRATEPSRRLRAAARDRDDRSRRLVEARQAAEGWARRLSPEEVRLALAQARDLEKRFLPVLRPTWWRLRRLLGHSFDFGSSAVRPTWAQALEALDLEYRRAEELEKADATLRLDFGISGDIESFLGWLDELRDAMECLPPELRDLHRQLVEAGEGARIVVGLLEVQAEVRDLGETLDSFLEEYEHRKLPDLRGELHAIEAALDGVEDFLHCLSRLAELPEELYRAIRRFPLDLDRLEASCIERTLEHVLRDDRSIARFGWRAHGRHAGRLEGQLEAWQDVNAEVILERARGRFQENAHLSSAPLEQLDDRQKERKRAYARGRRELEHEFGKKMRYKSIRDLVAGDSGRVVQDLKPIWLMSPLSVSDTLPLDTGHFDVVIFDEASQITVEEAVPSVFRARQIIVVGDEMQLPPTNFFSARRSEEEDLLWIDEGGEVVEYDLGSNSFLNQVARHLPSTMLGWHYRSRSESLISFSNSAFYEGRLLTVPDERVSALVRAPIVVSSPGEDEVHVEALLDRPISFHHVEKGVYRKRRNRPEADTIAALVRGLLLGGTGLSIGIVAFSEAQQDEIESALERLGQKDAKFRDCLEAELEREEDDQYVGLLVKNLENIQGDERDVIILSVCYGRDADGRMLMHFGPINQRGGEKRLNVAFSRARRHMAIVSSIRHTDITNDYNDGAACLKNYLRYGDMISRGDTTGARRVLREMVAWTGGRAPAEPTARHPVVDQLAAALGERGHTVDLGVGQSHFRCDLAVRGNQGDRYELGVLVDTPEYYRQDDLIEREVMKPKLLRAFGWNVVTVLTKDWREDRDAVLDRLERALAAGSPRDD